ncbi:hypothetical protein B0H10DRAFT_649250 [Mycena sp. CBHHK59/15]|nr:hypothetical protein B0H10DRAFT_649250 [Mycena sp. CBHHK59/15]
MVVGTRKRAVDGRRQTGWWYGMMISWLALALLALVPNAMDGGRRRVARTRLFVAELHRQCGGRGTRRDWRWPVLHGALVPKYLFLTRSARIPISHMCFLRLPTLLCALLSFYFYPISKATASAPTPLRSHDLLIFNKNSDSDRSHAAYAHPTVPDSPDTGLPGTSSSARLSNRSPRFLVSAVKPPQLGHAL